MDSMLAGSLVLLQNARTVVYLVQELVYIIIDDCCLGTR